MAAKHLQIESVDRFTSNTVVITFSDGAVVVVTDEELLKQYADRRKVPKAIDSSLDKD